MTVKDAVGIQRQAGDRQRASGPGLGLQTEPSGGKLPSRVAVRLEQALGELVPPYLLRRKHLPSGSAAETRAGAGNPGASYQPEPHGTTGQGPRGWTHSRGGRRPEAGAGLRGKAPRDLQDREEAGVRLQSPGAGRLVSRRPAGRGRRGRNAPGKVAKLRKLKRSGRERREMATSKIWERGAVARAVPLTVTVETSWRTCDSVLSAPRAPGPCGRARSPQPEGHGAAR